MAKKQTRRSISVSRTTYERLKAFCETNNISMSQFVETRVGDFLGEGQPTTTVSIPMAPRPAAPTTPRPTAPQHTPAIKSESRPMPSAPIASAPQPVPMTSAAARFAVEPPPPVIKQKQQEAAPKPAEKRPDQIFTF
jgi:hypothetical protein